MSQFSTEYGLTKEEFQELQNKYLRASEQDRVTIQNSLITCLYEDMRNVSNRRTGQSIQATSIVNSLCPRFVKAAFQNDSGTYRYETIDDFMNYVRCCIRCSIVSRYKKDTKFFQIPENEEGEPVVEPEVPDWSENYMAMDSAMRLVGILEKILRGDEILLLRMRAVDEKSYADIAQELGCGRTADSVRMQYQRILKKVRNSPAIIAFEKEMTDDE